MTEQEEKNMAIVSAAYQQWHDSKGGSVENWIDLMSDDVQFQSMGEDSGEGLAFARAYRSMAKLADYFRGLLQAMEMIHYTADQYIAQGDTVVMIGSTAWQSKATGKRFDTPKVDVLKLRNGKVVEFAEYFDTAKVLATLQP